MTYSAAVLAYYLFFLPDIKVREIDTDDSLAHLVVWFRILYLVACDG